MPFHPYGRIKGIRVGQELPLEDLEAPDEKTIYSWIEKIRACASVPVNRG
jgi:hypothetical protein